MIANETFNIWHISNLSRTITASILRTETIHLFQFWTKIAQIQKIEKILEILEKKKTPHTSALNWMRFFAKQKKYIHFLGFILYYTYSIQRKRVHIVPKYHRHVTGTIIFFENYTVLSYIQTWRKTQIYKNDTTNFFHLPCTNTMMKAENLRWLRHEHEQLTRVGIHSEPTTDIYNN